jgi:peroxiredoxin
MYRNCVRSLVSAAVVGLACVAGAAEYETLAVGSPAPDFSLPATDGRTYALADFAEAELLLIVFTCNHCPTAQSYEERLVQLTKDYADRGVAVVAVSPNDPLAVRLDELGYTDLGDTLDDMKIRAEAEGFNFPYLYDGETQAMSRAYGPIATPHVFLFDRERRLRFVGRIDDSEEGVHDETSHDTRNALDALLAGKPVPVESTKVFGCSVKWADKRESRRRHMEKLAQEPVTLEMADAETIRKLVANEDSDKLRLINVWATWCGPCVVEFPDFVEMNRMYRQRDFELVSISADDPSKQADVLKFLKKQQASHRNYQFDSDDQYALIEAVDEKWGGALPYTMLVEPGGKVVWSIQGEIDPLEVRRMIVDRLGREKDW